MLVLFLHKWVKKGAIRWLFHQFFIASLIPSAYVFKIVCLYAVYSYLFFTPNQLLIIYSTGVNLSGDIISLTYETAQSNGKTN